MAASEQRLLALAAAPATSHIPKPRVVGVSKMHAGKLAAQEQPATPHWRMTGQCQLAAWQEASSCRHRLKMVPELANPRRHTGGCGCKVLRTAPARASATGCGNHGWRCEPGLAACAASDSRPANASLAPLKPCRLEGRRCQHRSRRSTSDPLPQPQRLQGFAGDPSRNCALESEAGWRCHGRRPLPKDVFRRGPAMTRHLRGPYPAACSVGAAKRKKHGVEARATARLGGGGPTAQSSGHPQYIGVEAPRGGFGPAGTPEAPMRGGPAAASTALHGYGRFAKHHKALPRRFA